MVGIKINGKMRIGDKMKEGEDIMLRGVKNFEKEIMRSVSIEEEMKEKKMREEMKKMEEEGVVKILVKEDG